MQHCVQERSNKNDDVSEQVSMKVNPTQYYPYLFMLCVEKSREITVWTEKKREQRKHCVQETGLVPVIPRDHLNSSSVLSSARGTLSLSLQSYIYLEYISVYIFIYLYIDYIDNFCNYLSFIHIYTFLLILSTLSLSLFLLSFGGRVAEAFPISADLRKTQEAQTSKHQQHIIAFSGALGYRRFILTYDSLE